MAIIGSAHVQIRADDKLFEKDVRAAVRKIKDVSISVKADMDMTKVNKKISDLRYRLRNNVVMLPADIDLSKVEKKLQKVYDVYHKKEINFDVIANTENADTRLQELTNRHGKIASSVDAQASVAKAEAQLKLLTRRRRAQIDPVIGEDARRALLSAMNIISGTLPFDKVKASLYGVVTGFEAMALKSTLLVTAVGAVSDAVLVAGANLLAIGADITRAIGIINMAPAGIIAVAAAAITMRTAWKGFGAALSEDAKKAAEAMEKLPPEAREAADAIRGLWREAQKPIQAAFWEQMGTSLQDMISTLLPQLTRGLENVSGSMGRITSQFFESLERWSDGKIEGILSNVADMFRNMADGIDPMVSAFMTLAEVGATYLPQFGTYLAEYAEDFRQFIDNAKETGQIDIWIRQSIQTFQDLGRVIGATTSIFSGLADAARMSGAAGLGDLAAGLERIATIVNGEPFKSRLVRVLSDARVGMDALGESVKKAAVFFGESAESIGSFLALTGQTAGVALDNLVLLFDGTRLGSGSYAALQGLKDMLSGMGPAFSSAGNAMGDLGFIAAELLRAMGPGFNQLFETIETVIHNMRDGIIDAIPVLNEFVQSVLAVAHGPIALLATGIGNLLTMFANLPGPIQTAIASFGLFLLLKNKFSDFFRHIDLNGQVVPGRLATGFESARKRVGTSVDSMSSGFSRVMTNMHMVSMDTTDGIARSARGIQGAWREAGQSIGNSFSTSRIAQNFDILSSRVTDFARVTGDSVRTSIVGGFDQMAESAKRGARAIDPMEASIRKSAMGTTSLNTAFANSASAIGTAMGTSARHVATFTANTARSVSSAVKNIGASIGPAVGRGIGSLTSLLGGGWGIAIMGATLALGAFAQAQADAKARVDSLADSLDEQTGRLTGSTKKIQAEQMLDFDNSSWDAFWRMGQKSATEAMAETGTSVEKVLDKINDPKNGKEYIKAWEDIRGATNSGRRVTDEMAAAVGHTADELNDLTTGELNRYSGAVLQVGEDTEAARQKIEDIAKATGATTIEAQRLAANYDVLASSTSSVSEKFSALKDNMDILNDGKRSAIEAERDHQQALINTSTSLSKLAEEQKVALSDLGNLYVDATGSIDMSTQAGINFSRVMTDQADAMILTATTAYDTAIKNGKTVEEAAVIAGQSMNDSLGTFRETLVGLGLDADQINGIINNLGLDPENFQASLAVDTASAEASILRTTIMAEAFKDRDYAAVLNVMPDAAKAKIAEALGMTEEFANGDWDAVLNVLGDSESEIQNILLKLMEVTDGDYAAVLEAEDLITPKVMDASQSIINNLHGKSVDLDAVDGVTPVIDGVNARPMDPKVTEMVANDMVTDLVNHVNGLPLDGKISDLNAVDFATGMVDYVNQYQLNNKLNSLQTQNLVTEVVDMINNMRMNDKDNSLTSKDYATAVIAAVNNMDMPGKHNDLTTWDGVSPIIRGVNGMPFPNRRNSLDTNDNVSGVITNLNNMELKNKSNVITTTIRQITEFITGKANGGIMENHVDVFANGGIRDTIDRMNVTAFANGSENHVAQIANGGTPYRVWAEPETGGEAYIPLSPNKRARSLKILEEVARRFGYSLAKNFAQGGIMDSIKPSRSTSGLYVTPSSQPVVRQGSTSSDARPIVVQVNPSAALDEAQVGRIAAKELYWQMNNNF